MRTAHYSDFLAEIAALMNKTPSGLTDDEKTIINPFFNHAMRFIWDSANWKDVCPIGEARFTNSDITNPVDIAASTWTSTAVSVTGSSTRNPLDSRVNMCKILETAALSAHNVYQAVEFVPSSSYSTSGYFKRKGRNYCYISANDGVTIHVAHFNLATGVVVSTSNCTATINISGNASYKCQIDYTSASTASTGTVTYGMTDDGSTLIYTGDITKGIYAYGLVSLPIGIDSQYYTQIPLSQVGESEMEAVFSIWKDNPALGTRFPQNQAGYVDGDTIQLVGTANTNPLYIDYRKKRPSYTGAAFSASATYTAGTQVLYTLTSGDQDFYLCLATTTAGQDPEDTPAKWRLLEIPDVFSEYAVHAAFADVLRTDGQLEKAEMMDKIAEEVMNNALDVLERQQGGALRTKYSTHVTYRM